MTVSITFLYRLTLYLQPALAEMVRSMKAGPSVTALVGLSLIGLDLNAITTLPLNGTFHAVQSYHAELAAFL